MATVTTDFLAGLMTNFRAIFQETLDEAGKIERFQQRIATTFPSETDQESYGWMGSLPDMSRWTDQRQYKALKAYDYTLKNLSYEGTIEVDRETIEDDKYGMIAPRIRGLAARALRHMDRMIIDKLDAGETDLAYDSLAMFVSSGRTIGDSASIVNLLAGSYDATTTEVLAGLKEAYRLMQLFEDDHGQKMGLVPDTILASPAMALLIKEALLPTVAGTVIPLRDIYDPAKVFSAPWIDLDANDWYVLCTTAEIKPLIFQLRKAPEFVALDDPKSDHVFKNKTFLYGVDDRFVVGYGDPRTAIKVVA